MHPLMAQQDLGEIIVPLIVAAIYFLSYIIKGSGEKKPAAQKKPAAPQVRRHAPPRVDLPPSAQLDIDPVARPQKAPPATTAQQEMEKLLRDLGVREPNKPSERPKTPSRPPQQQQRRPKPPKQQQKQAERRPKSLIPTDQLPSQQRELHSRLENRHAHTVHSEIEEKHLQTHIAAQQTAAPKSPHESPASSLAHVLSNRITLRQAFMLTVVLGPPHGLRSDTEKF